MNDVRKVDFLIVGQGLAGSALAMRCSERRHKIIVLDDPSQNHSSWVAAGLFNPFTGQLASKTWLADKLFPALFEYYRWAERETGGSFFHPLPLYKPFATAEEQNDWMGKSVADSHRHFVSHISVSSSYDGIIDDPFGGVTFRHTGYLDTRAYLEAVRSFLENRGAFRTAVFDADELDVHDDSVRYGDIIARKVVFCQGVQNVRNPWFCGCPVIPLKGELLDVQCGRRPDVIFNRGVFMVPGPDPGWKVGATYDRTDQAPGITSWARSELTRKLEELVRIPYTVTGQHWGVRPTTPDRRPMIGTHPLHRSLAIFNGLGTKGVSLAPYFSDVLVRWLEGEGTIVKGADVSRFKMSILDSPK